MKKWAPRVRAAGQVARGFRVGFPGEIDTRHDIGMVDIQIVRAADVELPLTRMLDWLFSTATSRYHRQIAIVQKHAPRLRRTGICSARRAGVR